MNGIRSTGLVASIMIKYMVYGIWTMADVRGMWYWKDMLTQANVDPNSLRTWDGYVSSAEKPINSVLQGLDVQGIHLVGVDHSPDM